ncbi:MAG: lycopene cyclase [Flavobacteriaceae bacterium]|nr:lycopene cyclase [Flavobacteriaceae bacterium]
MHEFDYIITGSGASGLMLAFRMANDVFFDNKSILIIDKEKKNSNDRTWCYWEKNTGEWDDVVSKSWEKILFKSASYKAEKLIDPYTYKMIRSSDFYKKVWSVLEAKKNFTFVNDTVINISHKQGSASVLTLKTEYHAKQLMNSVALDKNYNQQLKYPSLHQHFVGWFIETKEDSFESDVATFMDFTVNQKGNTRFMYVLPLSSKKALVEYTLFSERLLKSEEYEDEIMLYLKNKSITNYTILEKEQGSIPMTAYKFWKHNSRNVINIGTVGGWSKASTGYTFMNTTKKTKELVEFIKTGESFIGFRKKSRFWTYDLLLLDVLSKHNELGAKIFSSLFKKNSIHVIFRFLDEETRFSEDLKIMFSLPPLKFIKALYKRVF